MRLRRASSSSSALALAVLGSGTPPPRPSPPAPSITRSKADCAFCTRWRTEEGALSRRRFGRRLRRAVDVQLGDHLALAGLQRGDEALQLGLRGAGFERRR